MLSLTHVYGLCKKTEQTRSLPYASTVQDALAYLACKTKDWEGDREALRTAGLLGDAQGFCELLAARVVEYCMADSGAAPPLSLARQLVGEHKLAELLHRSWTL